MTDILKTIGISAAVVIVALLLFPVGGSNVGGTYENVRQYFSAGIDVTEGGDIKVDGTTVIDASGNVDAPLSPSSVSYPAQIVTATTDTLTSSDLGETIAVEAASGTTITLPAATDGAFLRFVIGSAFDTANVIIDSAEGDNIDGTLIVAGAVVDCDGEDQINFVNDGENIGDFVELFGAGGQWFIGASGGLTSAKITCTDPS